MSMRMEVCVFLAYAAGMFFVYVFGRFFLAPVKLLLKMVLNSAAGGVIILLINFCGAAGGIFVPLNAITAFITGVLGIPGILLLIIYFI